MRKLFTLPILTILFAIVFYAITIIFPGPGTQPEFAGPAATIFSILLGFMVANSQSRMNSIYERLKTENSNNLIIYRLSAAFGTSTQDKIRDLLDQYLMDQIDYNIEEFEYSSYSFEKLYNYILQLDPTDNRQDKAIIKSLDILNLSTVNRGQIEAESKHRLSLGQWASILALMFVTIITVWTMSDGGWWGGAVLTALASAVVLMVLTMRDMNNLKWGNASWTWQPLHKLFKDIGLVPYYTSAIINDHEADIAKGELIRIGVVGRDGKKEIKTIHFGE
ncbi:MAG: hypothetical protein LBK50_03230 [Candidatus Nomurabacteria bacterium]|nr:hypothetical protein [Candidatus Nomurabacteria bacterium]